MAGNRTGTSQRASRDRSVGSFDMNIFHLAQAGRWFITGYPGRRYQDLLDRSQHWSRDELTAWRDHKLHALVTHCYNNVPFYRNVMKARKLQPSDIKGLYDLQKLPILTKHTLRQHYNDFLATNLTHKTLTWAKTGGTTGEPIRIARNQDCVAMAAACYSRGLAWGGLRPWESRVKLFGGSLGVEPDRPLRQIGAFLRGEVFLSAFALRRATAQQYFDKIRASRSRFLIGYASAIFRLAAFAKDMDQNIRFAAVFPTAELLLKEWEETINLAFGCKVLPYYGCGEVHSLGFSHPAISGYLIPEEHALIEVADKAGTSTPYGEGQFLITDLDNYAMPILRYLNGDAGKIVPPSSAYPFSRIERLDGRYNSLLLTDTGDLISGVIGTHIFRSTVSVAKYQIIQVEPLLLVIKIVPRESLAESDRTLITSRFSEYLGKAMKIKIEVVPDLASSASGKSVFVINHCLPSPTGLETLA